MVQARCAVLLALALVLLCISHRSDAKSSTVNVHSARKEDVKFIKCGVCEEIAKQLSRQVKKKSEKVAPKKLTEFEIIELTENICNIKTDQGDWMTYLDIVEDGDRLKLVEQQEEGECNTECKTIERACQEVMGDYDTDVAEFIFKQDAQRSALSRILCKDLSKACVGKPPAVPKYRKPGEPFTPKPIKDAEMAKLMRSMSDMPGAPGMQMYSREQLLNGGLGMEDHVDDDDDDNDVEERTQRPSLQSGLLDQAQRTLDSLRFRLQNNFDAAKSYVKKASGPLRKWWYGSQSSSKRRSASSRSKAEHGKASKSEL